MRLAAPIRAAAFVWATTAVAIQAPPGSSRFEALVVADPTSAVPVASVRVDSIPASDPQRVGWEQFRVAHGSQWSISLDQRSGAPLLVEGSGIPWQTGRNVSIDSLALSLRTFIAANRSLLLASDDEMVVNREASVELLEDVWQVVFDRVIAGVPVAGERYLFTIGHGKLISFGTPRWSRIDADPKPTIDSAEAQARTVSYMGLTGSDGFDLFAKPRLELIPLPPADGSDTSALVWRLRLRTVGEPQTWEAAVDAHTGAIRSFNDVNDYAIAKGGVYATSTDAPCPGCERPDTPMPFTDVLAGTTQTTTSTGFFNCSPAGGIALTRLAGPYFKAIDACGDIAETVTCDADLDLHVSSAGNCVNPDGSTMHGNTQAARTSFYHLNRAAEHARSWLPTNTWIRSQVVYDVNRNWDGCYWFWDTEGLSFNKANGDYLCANGGEIPDIVVHEWGHGLDNNDGGGADRPNEAYADVTAMLASRASCIGPGFRLGQNCGGYGNACLQCTGLRELDWDRRAQHTPTIGTALSQCFGGFPSGPCGRSSHCEGYLAGETLWDLAARDLPASGLAIADAWQLVDKLWYLSRPGSGGNAYNCPELHRTDGCGATSWFSKLRAVDDDDGNLANGTPHAAAIFAAFNRHTIACGTAADASNQSSTICPAIGQPDLFVEPGNGFASLTWTPVANAVAYRVMRNDASCDGSSTAVQTTTATSWNNTGLGNGFTEYYRIQPIGANGACDGLLSKCREATPAALAGSVKMGATSFGCTGQAEVIVTDVNVAATTTTVSLVSTSETSPESIVVTQIAPGSSTYKGSIVLTAAPPAHDGVLSVAAGDTITATYVDANDGAGGIDVPHWATATIDCVVPAISKVQATNVAGTAARITWSTNEPASSTIRFGTAPPPGTTKSAAAPVLGHGLDLSGLNECTSYLYSVESTDVAGNTATDGALGSYHTFTTGKSTPKNSTSQDTPIPIPDNSPAGATSTIVVTDVRTVQDVDVRIDVDHTYDGDLTFSLITPSGKSILLANPHGGSGDNFVKTVFDDEAAGPLSGPAPFTGSFKPDSPLSVADGISSAGAWTFKAVDGSGQDTGSIFSWTLQLMYATPSCGPHAVVRSHALVADTCPTGGDGGGNSRGDAGEHVAFKLKLDNDGTVPLTGVTATITSATPGVVVTDGVASFPDVPAGGTADSLAPHFGVYLPTTLTCGGTVSFQVAVSANQGSWPGAFAQFVGRATNGTGRVLDERFDAGIPATWTILDGGLGGGAASKWTANNPGVRTISSPMLLPVATIDSDAAGPGATQDESLLTPVMDLSTATTATLQFDQFFRWFSGGLDEFADVDVRSSSTGGLWVNVLHQNGASSANPDHKALDITSQAAGAADAQVRFRNWNGSNEEYWQLDNVTIDTAAPGSCDMPVCALPVPGGAKPVADGLFGVPMRGSRADGSGSAIGLTWDVTTCASADQHVLYGDLADIPSLTVSGAACDLGTTGSAIWTGVPPGDLWFVVVGDDDATTEGSWGVDGGGQRGGAAPSGTCGLLTRNNSGVCP